MEEGKVFRFAKNEDLPAIVEIYNQAIRSQVATGHTEPFSVQDRKAWFNNFSEESYPIYVIEVNEEVVGYGTLSPYRPGRQAMRAIAEISFFLGQNFHRQGYGGWLLEQIIADCPRLGIKNLIAILLDINQPSVGLLEKYGFKPWGHFPGVVEFDDKTCGQLIYGMRIEK